MQVVVDRLPPRDVGMDSPIGRPWSFRWIGGHDWTGADPIVTAFRLRFTLESATTLRIHVTGDQRYALHLDGRRIGFGPERGSHRTWFLQTHDLELDAGRHVMVALVSWTPLRDELSHRGHIGLSPGLALYAEGVSPDLLNTGFAPWEAMTARGYGFRPASIFPGALCFIGARTDFDMRLQPDGVVDGDDGAGAWRPAAVGAFAETLAFGHFGERPLHMLHQGLLPAMFEGVFEGGRVRHAISCKDRSASEMRELPFVGRDGDAALAAAFAQMMQGGNAMELKPATQYRFLIDLEEYVCAWPVVTVSGGRSASMSIEWAEGLFRGLVYGTRKKNHRDEIEGRYFIGFGDSFVADGSAKPREFEPLWWEAGRYIMVTAVIDSEPLMLHGFVLRETHYPYEFASTFACDDMRIPDVLSISRRTLEMCSHETYFDCPYYEQLMYAGDTRIQMLCSYANAHDDRLVRKAMFLFDESRGPDGMTHVVAPCDTEDVIPSFSLWWVMMVHDYAFWRNDPEFVKSRMPGVRAVLEAFRECLDGRGRLRTPAGWNFVDWAEGGGWDHGVPPKADDGVNATMNFILAHALNSAAELEEFFGERHLAARNRETAAGIVAAMKSLWVPERRMFAENARRDSFSEHAQCMAILCGGLPEGIEPALVEDDADCVGATVYFSHYLFEALRVQKRPDAIFKRLETWFAMVARGLHTTTEFSVDPTRSDCHAWSAHPMFHVYATFAGIRPSSPGFRTVRIAPQPGPLTRIDASMVHPDGMIHVELEKTPGGNWRGKLGVPQGIAAEAELPDGRVLAWGGGDVEIHE